MTHNNVYDVTKWPIGNPYEDIGEVINSMISDIKERQVHIDEDKGGKPGAVIYIPPGDYYLRTQVKIDISFLKIVGSGHGFTSSSIRFNVPEEEWKNLHELWPGGSRIKVDLHPKRGEETEASQAAFYIAREGDPRLSSIEFSGFCIDGLHFVEDENYEIDNPENTYTNGKIGIYAETANDSFRITEMGFVYLEHALVLYHSDAISIHHNFIAECGNCIELRGWGQASKITDNLIGAGFKGYSIFAENFGGLLITANNIFPRGKSSIHLEGVTRSNISNNRLHAFYPGMIILKNSSENLIATNHFQHDYEPWEPFIAIHNGLGEDFGLVFIEGENNSVIANHFSKVLKKEGQSEPSEKPVIIRVNKGNRNYIATNHFVTTEVNPQISDSCYSAQVNALLTTEAQQSSSVTTVFIAEDSIHNTVLDSGKESEVVLNKEVNAFRPIPEI